jgi:hypothetical protein
MDRAGAVANVSKDRTAEKAGEGRDVIVEPDGRGQRLKHLRHRGSTPVDKKVDEGLMRKRNCT